MRTSRSAPAARFDHRLRRWPAAGHRRPDRRHRHGLNRARHRHRAVPAGEDRARPAGACGDAGRRAQSPGQAQGPAASRPRAAQGVPAVPARRVRRGNPGVSGNASGGGQPGWIVKCKGWETDPNAYIYVITQAPVWPALCKVIGQEIGSRIPAMRPPTPASTSSPTSSTRSRNGPRPRPSSRSWRS